MQNEKIFLKRQKYEKIFKDKKVSSLKYKEGKEGKRGREGERKVKVGVSQSHVMSPEEGTT